MSGRSSNGSGRGKGRGRGSGRGFYRKKNGGDKPKDDDNKKEMKFTPKIAGKSQGYTYETVKEHIPQETQKTLVNGEDIASNLRKGEDTGISDTKPVRAKAVKIEITESMSAAAMANAAEERRMEQDGLDIECRVRLERHTDKEKTYDENKCKAFTIIHTYCNQTMRNRIEESKDYEAVIRNDPFKLLSEIKLKMYGQVRAKYEFSQVTDTLVQLFGTRQEHGETLTDYAKRFKQSRDNVKSILGESFLDEFISHTDEYIQMSDEATKKDMTKKAYSRWTAYMMLRNGDHNKYGTLKTTLNNQYALGNNQWPGTCSAMTDVMTNHKWDEKYGQVDRKNREKNRQTQNQPNNDTTEEGVTLAQNKKIRCFKCGEEGHLCPDCPLGDIPKAEWWLNKAKMSAAQKTKCFEIAENMEKSRERNEEKNTNEQQKNVTWSGLQRTRRVKLFQK